MELKERLRGDLSEAMRSGDTRRRDVLRMMLAAIKQSEVDSRTTLDDAGVQDVLRKQLKQRRESIVDYERAGRAEDVSREMSDMAIIESYLPQMMSREEIEQLATSVIAEQGIVDAKATGQVVGRVMSQAKGRADGSVVNEVVRQLLQSP